MNVDTSLPTKNNNKIVIDILNDSPVRVRIHGKKFIASITEATRADPDKIPGICVAYLEESKKFYIVDGHARVHAYSSAGISEIKVAEVINVKSVIEIVTEHVKRNTNSNIDPFKIYEAMLFLEKKGVDDPVTMLHLSESLKEAVESLRKIPKDAIAPLVQFIEEAKMRFYEVRVPPHIFVYLAELANDKEVLDIVLRFLLDVLRGIREEKDFSFPNQDQMKGIINRLYNEYMQKVRRREGEERNSQNPEERKGEIVVFQREGGNDTSSSGVKSGGPVTRTSSSRSAGQYQNAGSSSDDEPEIVEIKEGESGAKPSFASAVSPPSTNQSTGICKIPEEYRKKADEVLGQISQKGYFQCDNCKKSYFVDMKNGWFKDEDETSDIRKVRVNEIETVFCLSKACADDFKDKSKITSFRFGSPTEIIEVLTKMTVEGRKSNARYLLIVAE